MDLQNFRVSLEQHLFSKLHELEPLSTIEGFNSIRNQHLLNIAVSCLRDTGEAYFEVGCFNGSSLYAASRYNNDIPKYACDIKKTKKLEGTLKYIENISFFEYDFFSLDLYKELDHKIGVFFYDGMHEYENLINALTQIEPHLADKAIIIADDLNYGRVYNAWRDFFKRPENTDRWTITHEFWTPDKFKSLVKGDKDGWWDSIGIAEYERIPDRPNQIIEWMTMKIYNGRPPYKHRKGTLWPAEFKNLHGNEEANDADL